MNKINLKYYKNNINKLILFFIIMYCEQGGYHTGIKALNKKVNNLK